MSGTCEKEMIDRVVGLTVQTRWMVAERRRGWLTCFGEAGSRVMRISPTVSEAHKKRNDSPSYDVSEKWGDSWRNFDKRERCSCFARMLRVLGGPLILPLEECCELSHT